MLHNDRYYDTLLTTKWKNVQGSGGGRQLTGVTWEKYAKP
jgi:hypothetical protein